jgi:ubiquinone/menaquinone biosynthesis C-methylase UbiE
MYQEFAQVYDELMKNVDYKAWTEYIERMFKLFNIKPKNIIDLACGTGNITIPLAKRNYNIIGIDISQDMLSIAEQKAREHSLNIQWICQDMINFQGFTKQDAIICACDGLNYILKVEDLQSIFSRVYTSLRQGGIFVFDMNSRYKIEEVLAEQTFAYAGEEISYIWENYYNKDQEIIDFELSFFVKNKENYKRFNEIHKQKAYSINNVIELLKHAGFKKIDYYSAYSLEKPNFTSERIQYVALK